MNICIINKSNLGHRSLELMTLSLQPIPHIFDACYPIDTATPYCTVYTPVPSLSADPLTVVYPI